VNDQSLSPDEMLGLEAIILPGLRPVSLVRGNRYEPVAGEFEYMNSPEVRAVLEPLLPRVGRIELPMHPAVPYGGTGFVVGDDLIMTNRHVAELFTQGVGTKTLAFRSGEAAIDLEREQREESARPVLLTVADVMMVHPYWDMALLRVEGLNRKALPLGVAAPENLADQDIVVVGYPGRGRDDVTVEDRVFGGIYFVKRFEPGKLRPRRDFRSFGKVVSALVHDASTLGGNSGSVVIDVKSGTVVGLHVAGVYLDAN
jgi:endonuclease G, mitochondrial